MGGATQYNQTPENDRKFAAGLAELRAAQKYADKKVSEAADDADLALVREIAMQEYGKSL